MQSENAVKRDNFFAAILDGDLEKVKKLVGENKDLVNSREYGYRYYAFEWAIKYEKLDIAKFLKENGADPTKYDFEHPIVHAARNPKADCLKYLIEDLNIDYKNIKSREEKLDILATAITDGVKKTKTDFGVIPLKVGSLPCVKYCIEQLGFDPRKEINDEYGVDRHKTNYMKLAKQKYPARDEVIEYSKDKIRELNTLDEKTLSNVKKCTEKEIKIMNKVIEFRKEILSKMESTKENITEINKLLEKNIHTRERITKLDNRIKIVDKGLSSLEKGEKISPKFEEILEKSDEHIARSEKNVKIISDNIEIMRNKAIQKSKDSSKSTEQMTPEQLAQDLGSALQNVGQEAASSTQISFFNNLQQKNNQDKQSGKIQIP